MKTLTETIRLEFEFSRQDIVNMVGWEFHDLEADIVTGGIQWPEKSDGLRGPGYDWSSRESILRAAVDCKLVPGTDDDQWVEGKSREELSAIEQCAGKLILDYIPELLGEE